MDDFSPSDLKTILHSKRANLYYLQHCRVLVNGGRVEYVTDEGSKSRYWNIPIANTTSILLGTGTSITQAAMRELAKAGVLVGFCGRASEIPQLLLLLILFPAFDGAFVVGESHHIAHVEILV